MSEPKPKQDVESEYRWLNDNGAAFGAPGVPPRWTSSKKDSVSTAYSASSRVWFTLSHGTLNEIYFPTIDRPQTRDMELLFTDEETFFHEEKRNFEYDFHYADADAPIARVVASDPDNRYTVTKEFIADPHHPVVLMNVKLTGDEAVLSRLKCYVLLAPHLDGGGAGNSARSLMVAGRRTLLAWKNDTSLALGVDCGFSRSSCGFVGTSDGYQDLSSHMRMEWQFGEAMEGNIALTGEIDCARNREFTVAIAFGTGHHAALSGLMQTLSTPYPEHAARFVLQWHRAESPADLVAASMDNGRLMRISHNIVLTHEDKTYSGAFIASASIPWGASKGDDDLGGYHLVWTRDMVQSATALLACGRIETARRALVYLACTQRPDGGFAQNFWIDGTAYWTGIQLDEVAFPIILAWRLWKLDGLGKFDIFPFVERAAAFLVRFAPVTQQERWEENSGYSPSTLAAVIAGLVCAADIARAYKAIELGCFLEDYADWIEAHLDEWTTTDDGYLLPGVKRHYMRIRPPAPGEPFHNPNIPPGFIQLANREPGEQTRPPMVPAGAATTTTATARRRMAAPTTAPGRAAPGLCWAANAPTTNSPPATTSSPSSRHSSASPRRAACCPSRSGTTPTCRPRASTRVSPQAPPSRSSGLMPSTSSSFAPSPMARSSTLFRSSPSATPCRPAPAPSAARLISSSSPGPSRRSRPAGPCASSIPTASTSFTRSTTGRPCSTQTRG
jgi:glucoamylase